MSGRYTVAEAPLSQTNATTAGAGLYMERTVRNLTGTPVVLIDRFNNREVIPCMSYGYSTSSNVQICERTVVLDGNTSARAKSDAANTIAQSPGRIISVSSWELQNGPVYVDEIDRLVATAEQASSATHPAYGHTYETALEHAIGALCSGDNTYTLRVFANDPTGEITSLYIHQFGSTLSIPVTRLQHNDSYVTFVIINHRRVEQRFSFALDQISEGDGLISLGSGFTIPVGVSEEQVASGLAKALQWHELTPEQVEKQLTELNSAHQCEIKALTAKADDAADEYRMERARLENKLNEVKLQLEQSQADANRYKAAADRFEGWVTADTKHDTVEQSHVAAVLKHRGTELETKTKELQYWAAIAKICGGVAIAALTWWVKSQLDSKPKRSS